MIVTLVDHPVTGTMLEMQQMHYNDMQDELVASINVCSQAFEHEQSLVVGH